MMTQALHLVSDYPDPDRPGYRKQLAIMLPTTVATALLGNDITPFKTYDDDQFPDDPPQEVGDWEAKVVARLEAKGIKMFAKNTEEGHNYLTFRYVSGDLEYASTIDGYPIQPVDPEN